MDQARRNDYRDEERLKRLLFSEELDLLETVRGDLARLDRRVGDDEALTASVRRVVADALREADVADHERVAGALAPLVVETVRTEIEGSREHLIDLLRPAAPKLLRAGVGLGLRAAADRLERVVWPPRWLDRRREATAGGAFRVVEAVLIDRQRGLVLARRGAGADGYEPRPEAVAPVPAANDPTAAAALAFVSRGVEPGREGRLHRTSFGDGDLHVRATPVMILALHTEGPVPSDLPETVEDGFFELLDKWGVPIRDGGADLSSAARQSIAVDLAAVARSGRALAWHDPDAGIRKPRAGYAILALAVIVVVAGIPAWLVVDARERRSLEAQVEAILDRPDFAELPVLVAVEPPGRVTLAGMVPDGRTRTALVEAVGEVVPDGAVVRARLGVVPTPDPVGLQEMERAVERLEEQVREAGSERVDPLPQADAWLAQRRIRFDEGDTYLDPDRAGAVLDDVAGLLEQWPESWALRVVGYSDITGSPQAVQAASRARAQRVSDDLVARGVGPERLVPVGRGAERPVSEDTGAGSPNRRVELELFVRS